MRITVCELPHEPPALEQAWNALCEHTTRESSELVLLPELCGVEPLWESDTFDARRWNHAEAVGLDFQSRLDELNAPWVVGTRPVTMRGRPFNEGYLWSWDEVRRLRRKRYLPDEPGGREAVWFDRGDDAFPAYCAGSLSFGLNICTELWALETYASYARQRVSAILSPRATGAATIAKWLAAGVVAAVRSGAFSISSNRVDASGACGGVGWIISPDGDVLARTSAAYPFATIDVDLARIRTSSQSYPRNVFEV